MEGGAWMPGCPGKGGLDRAGLLPIGSILQALCCASSVLCPLPPRPPKPTPPHPTHCPPPLAQSGGAPPSPECQGVAEVVSQLQGRLGQQLWPREQPSLAQPLVPSAAAVAVFVQTGACGGGASALGWVPGWMAGWLAAAFAASHVCCSPSRPSSGLHALLSHIFS
jgi:hypothetical protein